MRVSLVLLATVVSSFAGPQGWGSQQARAGVSVTANRFLGSGQRQSAPLFYRGSLNTGYLPGSPRGNAGPLIFAPGARQNRPEANEEFANNGEPRPHELAPEAKDPNPAIPSHAVSATQGVAQRPNSLPAGIKPQVTTPAERSQAAANINQKFQQAENKLANRPWDRPDRRNRLEQSRAFFIGLIDWGYPLSLLDTWCDDLLDDQVDVGMPVDLIDSYWGQPVSTQDYEEYYNPYEVCTYLTPDGNYRQVTFQNGLVAQAM